MIKYDFLDNFVLDENELVLIKGGYSDKDNLPCGLGCGLGCGKGCQGCSTNLTSTAPTLPPVSIVK